jgi:nucleotide-binding universal stress UspA family protein
MAKKTEAAQRAAGQGEVPMKALLAVVSDGTAASLLDSALLVAKRFGGRITGLNALTTEYAVVFGGEMGFSISSEVDRTLEREGLDRREQARALFTTFMRQHGVPMGSAAGDAPSAEWREESGRQNAVVGTLGRIFDLIVLERPAKLASLAEATLEDALFESGRPVLMTPPTRLGSIGERVLVAWNGSTETARTVAFAMPFLERAQSVQVVSVEGAMTPGPSGEELAQSLARNGISAIARHVTARDRIPGEVFLEEAKAIGADLLVKGAYTQSRLRQMIFGGATRHIIMEATMPVILAH